MPTAVGPNTKGEDNLVFGYDLGDSANSFPGIPAVNCSRVPTTSGNGNSTGNWTVTEITDGSITPPRKGARVFKFVAGTTSNLYRQANYYAGGGFTANNPQNPLILGKTSPSNFTTVSEPNKYRWGFWVRGVESNNAGWAFNIDIGDRGGASYTVGNKTDWYFISCDNATGTNYNAYPYDFFDIFSSNQGLTMYIADMGIMRAPGTVDSLPIMQAYPQWVDYGQERSYTAGLKDITGNSTIDLSNVSFDSNAQMVFDGTDDNLDADLQLNYGNFSVEMIASWNSVSDLFCAGSGAAGDGLTGGTYFNAHMTTSGFYVRAYSPPGGPGGWNTSGTVSSPSSTNTTYHITVVNIGTVWYFYKNGTLAGSVDALYTPDSASTRVGIFRNHVQTVGNAGEVFSFKAYNRALSASEIKANYNAIKGRFNI